MQIVPSHLAEFLPAELTKSSNNLVLIQVRLTELDTGPGKTEMISDWPNLGAGA
jgi:hypothetical protein